MFTSFSRGPSPMRGSGQTVRGHRAGPAAQRRWTNRLATGALTCAIAACLALPLSAQTITVVGTQHLTGLERAPDAQQVAHSVEALSRFEPTQVCIERMSGARIETLVADLERNGRIFRPDLYGFAARTILPIGLQMQAMLEYRPAGARQAADDRLSRWHALDTRARLEAVGLLLAGYEFYSAVLNWSWLDAQARNEAEDALPPEAIQALDAALKSVHEVYSLGVSLARRAGLHRLCMADSAEDEARGMSAAVAHGGQSVLDSPEVKARIEAYQQRLAEVWTPDGGPGALTAMLRFMNSAAFTELDRWGQWEPLREFDNDAGAFTRRLMYWHARTAAISAELFRALAEGPAERVIFIVGAAHRPFTEADLRAQPWVEVVPASSLLEGD